MAGNCNECSIEWVKGGKYAGITAYSNSKLKGKIEKLAKEYPEEVKIIARNEDGSIFAHAPIRYVKVSRPREVSEERKQEVSERFKKYRDKKATESYEKDFIFE